MKNNSKEMTKVFKEHYSNSFKTYGAVPKGADWGKEEDLLFRYKTLLKVIEDDVENNNSNDSISLLDVGCGYGGLLDYIKESGLNIHYTGIDIVDEMINYAENKHGENIFYKKDIFDFDPSHKFDYVVCNGILTQKLHFSIMDMDDFTHQLIKKMFKLCNKGISFNMMSTKVDFMVDNLYYRNPTDLFNYCFNELSHKIKLDHSYNLYEYTLYIYKRSNKDL